MTDKEIIKIKNAHCKYFEGQTGLCQVKEFKRCNPINCKLYTIDELSTIVDLQKQLQRKEQQCDELKAEITSLRESGKKSCAYCTDYIAKEKECEELKEKK